MHIIEVIGAATGILEVWPGLRRAAGLSRKPVGATIYTAGHN